MKRYLILIVGIGLFLLSACNDSSVTAPDKSITPTDQLPSSAREMITLYGASDDGAFDLDMTEVSRHDLNHFLADTSYDVYGLTVAWGSFTPASPTTPSGQTIDWSGSMYVNGVGEMGVVSTISFEPFQDSLIPTNNPISVAWHSQTNNDLDGIVSFIAMKRGIVYVVPPSLFITTIPKSVTIPVGELEHFQMFYPVNNAAGMIVYARKLKNVNCPRGAIQGRWIRSDSSMMTGTFEGVWREISTNAAQARPGGTLRGTFSTGDLRNPFEGDWLDSTGTVIGHLKGTWLYTDYAMCPLCGNRYGIFDGQILDLSNHAVGVVKGVFGNETMPSPLNLPFTGFYRYYCPTTSDQGISDN